MGSFCVEIEADRVHAVSSKARKLEARRCARADVDHLSRPVGHDPKSQKNVHPRHSEVLETLACH